jgi:hypothetical protein
MSPLQYHHGQLEVQREANTRHVADKLAHWVGPVARYALNADLFLFALLGERGRLQFAALSGPPPLAQVAGPGTLRLVPALATVLRPSASTSVGGLVISLARSERARLNGILRLNGGDALELEATEPFTLCRKYIVPSVAASQAPIAGPVAREEVSLDDPWVREIVAAAETSFLASISPDADPDVAHRGGPRGFLELDPAARQLCWTEFVGDGVFKSAGNIRATGSAALLVPDLASGAAVELAGRAAYETLRFDRRPRVDPLVRFRDPYPTQGRMTLQVDAAYRLRGFAWPCQPIQADRVTSSSEVYDQAPA